MNFKQGFIVGIVGTLTAYATYQATYRVGEKILARIDSEKTDCYMDGFRNGQLAATKDWTNRMKIYEEMKFELNA